MTNFPSFTMRELLEAGVHYGHKCLRWNPKMEPFIFGERNNLHIIDLQQTVPMLYKALKTVEDVAKNNGRILFVGTKNQASGIIAEQAKRCGQYYINQRWLGGTLTNWKTVSNSIKTMDDIEAQLADPELELSKKERLSLARKREKLERSLGGIRKMGGTPSLVVIIDTNKESIAIEESSRLGIPVVAVVDTNSDPDNVDFPVPGNDDATKSIQLYCRLFADAALSGIEQSVKNAGIDIGASAKAPKEKLPTGQDEKVVVVKKPAAKKSAPKKDDAEEKKDAKQATN